MPLQTPLIGAATPMQSSDANRSQALESDSRPRIPLPANPRPPRQQQESADASGGTGAEYIRSFRGTNPAAEGLRQYVNELKGGRVGATTTPLTKADLQVLQSFTAATEELARRESALAELASRCLDLSANSVPMKNAVERANEPGGEIAAITDEARRTVTLLDNMIEQNRTVRHDQIANLFALAMPAKNQMSLLPSAGISPDDTDGEKMRENTEKALKETRQNINEFLAFLKTNTENKDLFDTRDAFEINSVALRAVEEFFPKKSFAIGAVIPLLASEDISLGDVKKVAERLLKKRGASGIKIIFVRDILVPLQYIFNRQKLVGINFFNRQKPVTVNEINPTIAAMIAYSARKEATDDTDTADNPRDDDLFGGV
jgi:hypothetical protein